MRPLFILGSGGFACEVALWLRDAGLCAQGWSFEGFVTDDPAKLGVSLPLGRVVETEDRLWARPGDAALLVGLGTASTRRQLTRRALEAGFTLPNLVHPRALVPADLVSMGVGNILGPQVVVSCGAALGDGNLLNIASVVGHDARLGSGCVVGPGAVLAGGVVLGDAVLVGAGATVLQNVTVGSGASVGAGSLQMRDAAPGEHWFGVPARRLPVPTPEGG